MISPKNPKLGHKRALTRSKILNQVQKHESGQKLPESGQKVPESGQNLEYGQNRSWIGSKASNQANPELKQNALKIVRFLRWAYTACEPIILTQNALKSSKTKIRFSYDVKPYHFALCVLKVQATDWMTNAPNLV